MEKVSIDWTYFQFKHVMEVDETVGASGKLCPEIRRWSTSGQVTGVFQAVPGHPEGMLEPLGSSWGSWRTSLQKMSPSQKVLELVFCFLHTKSLSSDIQRGITQRILIITTAL